jgi:hypothetical protein
MVNSKEETSAMSEIIVKTIERLEKLAAGTGSKQITPAAPGFGKRDYEPPKISNAKRPLFERGWLVPPLQWPQRY